MKFTSYIAQDLKVRIGDGQPLPAKLTLKGLADHYGVSVTPVRTAVRELLDTTYLLRESNGRLKVNTAKQGAAKSRDPVSEPVPPRDWDAIVRQDVVRLSLEGQEAYVREEAAAQEYGIGRTVLRGILSRLAGHGMLEHVPRCGWRVRPFDQQQMVAYIQMRETLELKALDLARPRLDSSRLQKILDANSGQADGASRIDNSLHAYWIEQSNNFYIQDFFDRHGAYYTALFDYATPGASMVSEMASQHRDILEPMLAHDWSRAGRALAHHIRSQEPVLARAIERLTQAAPGESTPGASKPGVPTGGTHEHADA